MRLHSRTLDVVDSPITAAYDLVALRQDDRELLNLAQAAPTYGPAPEVIEHLTQVAHTTQGSGYTPVPGLPHLREAFAEELTQAYGGPLAPEHVLITSGANQAFCLLASTLAEPGDEVILVLPFYFNHDMWLRLAGFRPVYLDPGPGLVPTVEQARALITERTAMIVLVTPGNPSGVTLSPQLIADFAGLAAERGVTLVLDETYRTFRDTDAPPHDLFARDDWGGHVVSLHSFSKDLALPGYRVGAIVCAPDVHREVAKLMDCVAVCAPRIGQEAAWAGLTRAHEWRRERAREIAAHRRAFAAAMADSPGGFEVVGQGGYFAWVRHPFGRRSTQDVVRDLVVDASVLLMPGPAFMPSDEGLIRVSVCNLPDDQVGELVARLAESGA